MPTPVIDAWSGRSHAILLLAKPVLTGRWSKATADWLCKACTPVSCRRPGGTPPPFTNLMQCAMGLGKNLHRTTVVQRRRAGHAVSMEFVRREQHPVWCGSRSSETASPTCGQWLMRPSVSTAVWVTEHSRSDWRKRRGEPSALGRSCMVFDLVRYWAYDPLTKSGTSVD